MNSYGKKENRNRGESVSPGIFTRVRRSTPTGFIFFFFSEGTLDSESILLDFGLVHLLS